MHFSLQKEELTRYGSCGIILEPSGPGDGGILLEIAEPQQVFVVFSCFNAEHCMRLIQEIQYVLHFT